jgi:hypothetical protein
MMRYKIFLLLALSTIGSQGCGFSPEPTKPAMGVFSDLFRIGSAYGTFCSKGKAPANLEELLPFFTKGHPEHDRDAIDESVRLVKAGEYVIIWNEQRAVRPQLEPPLAIDQQIIIAYQRTVPERGGFVAVADGRVLHMSAAEFAHVARASEKSGGK